MLYEIKVTTRAIKAPSLYYVPKSNHPALVRRAVYSATRELGELTKEDYHDMLQEAQLFILKYAQGKHEAYQYKVARWAALGFYFRHILEGRAGQKRGGPWVEAHYSLNERIDTAAPVKTTTARVLPVATPALVKLLARTRAKGERLTARGIKAAKKDVRILQLLAAGYNNFGIAQELGISPASVRACRMRIRRTLHKLPRAA